jgi:thiosulfate/3-mercaptopyruvate sulfurtransferase
MMERGAELFVDNMWLKSHLDDHDLVVIDGRGPVAYSSGHIKNALPLGLDDVIRISEYGANLAIEGEDAENLFGKLGIDESKKVVVYGEHFDPSAARIAWTLLYNSHRNTRVLETAFSFIRRDRTLPIVRDLPKPIVTNFKSRANDCLRADERMVKEKSNDNGTVIIDSRTPLEHSQARIPGSLLHNWENGIGDDGKMIKSGEDLLNEFNASGITKNKEIICYCHSRTRASHKYFQFKHAGFNNVRCYDGSIDWAQRRNPIR